MTTEGSYIGVIAISGEKDTWGIDYSLFGCYEGPGLPVVYVFDDIYSAAIWYNLLVFSLGEDLPLNEVPSVYWDKFMRPSAQPPTKKSSKYYWVSVEMRRGKPLYRASITIDGKQVKLGSSVSEDKAALLVNRAIREYNLDRPLNVI